MGFTFNGIITDATVKELEIIKCQYPYSKHCDPEDMILIRCDLTYEELLKYALWISNTVLGRKFCVMYYATWAGPIDFVKGCVVQNGRIIEGSVHEGEDEEAGCDAFFRILLEYGVVVPERGYFAPFDKRHPGFRG